MRFLVVLGVAGAVLLLLAGIFVYALLPGVVENRISASLQERYELEERPAVKVSSSFPPELLLGRIDRVEASIDRMTRGGVALRDVRVDLEDVDVSVRSLLEGDVEREIGYVALRAEVPEEEINAYLRENNLGLAGGEMNVRKSGVIYRSEDALFGFPASVDLDLRVSVREHRQECVGGPRTIEVVPSDLVVGGFLLPPYVTRLLSVESRTLELGELPLGTELKGVGPEQNALVVRAER